MRVPLTYEAVDERRKQLGSCKHAINELWEIEPLVAEVTLKELESEKHTTRNALNDAVLHIVMNETKGHFNPLNVQKLYDEFIEFCMLVHKERSS